MVRFGFGVRSQVEDWHKRGIIDDALNNRLQKDLDTQKLSYSFSSVAIILGVICLCFGAMTFVAANWGEMPRLLRLITLLSSTGASYFVAVLFKNKGKYFFSSAFVLLGCGCFGATVMMVGQMYHLPGHGSGAILVWSLGTLAAAGLTRSTPTLGLATILATIWSCWLMIDRNENVGVHLWYLPLWLVCAGLAWQSSSRIAAHICALTLQAWLFYTLVSNIDNAFFPLAAVIGIAISLTLVSALLHSKDFKKWLNGFELSAVFYVLISSMVLLGLWYTEQYSRSFQSGAKLVDLFGSLNLMILSAAFISLLAAGFWIFKKGALNSKFDHLIIMALIIASILAFFLSIMGFPFSLEAFSLGFAVWVIRMGTRQESAAIIRLGYLGFTIALLLIYGKAAGGLLETSIFYIVAGAFLVAGALIAPKISGKKELTQ